MTEPNLRLEWRNPEELNDNPANWRTHPPAQAAALSAVIDKVGWAGACLYNEATGRLIDGHLRKQTGAGKIPVLVGSWTEEQEKLILATLDPLAAMAEADSGRLGELLHELESVNTTGLEDLLSGLQAQAGAPEPKEKNHALFRQLQELQPMAWVLIGVPLMEFGKISERIEEIAEIPGIVCEIARNDGSRH